MKKFIALVIVFVVLSCAVFAEVVVTGQVDAVVMPVQVIDPDEGDTMIGAGVGRNGSSDAPRARIGLSATNDTNQVGLNFMLRFYPTAGSAPKVEFDDFAEVWWQPISQVKIEAGKFVNNTFWGKIGNDNWQRYTAEAKNQDHIFTRFKSDTVNTTSYVGFMLGIKPIDPLYIGVSVPSVAQIGGGFPDTVGKYTYVEVEESKGIEAAGEPTTVGNAAHTYEKIQVGAGYTIENIGLVRAQYVGASYIFANADITPGKETWWSDNSKIRRIEAAFAYTGMEGLIIDVGGKVPLAFKDYEITGYDDMGATYVKFEGDTTYQAPYQVSLGAGYTTSPLDVKGRVDVQFGGNRKKDDVEYNLGLKIYTHLWPSYDLGFATVGLDVGYNYIGENTDKDGVIGKDTADEQKGGYEFGVGAWLKKFIGACSIKGGIGYHMGEVHGKKQDTVFSVPIIFEYSF
jgi:hypothetical protein